MSTQSDGGCLQVRKRTLAGDQTSQHLDLGLLSLKNFEKINFCCVSHPVHGILLWQPQQTKTIRGPSSHCSLSSSLFCARAEVSHGSEEWDDYMGHLPPGWWGLTFSKHTDG